MQLGLGGVVGGAHIAETRIGAQRSHCGIRRLGKRIVAVADKRELQAIAAAPDPQAVRRHRKGSDPGHLLHEAVDVVGDVLLAALALVPGGQRHGDEAGIGIAAEPGNGEHVLHLARLLERLDQRLDLAHFRIGVVEADVLRRPHDHRDLRAILGRGQLLMQPDETEIVPLFLKKTPGVIRRLTSRFTQIKNRKSRKT